jgi:hypothetical protein
VVKLGEILSSLNYGSGAVLENERKVTYLMSDEFQLKKRQDAYP